MVLIICIMLALAILLWPWKRHKWIYGRHGCSRRCTKCGEEQELYMLWVKPSVPDWWETTKSGDGSCEIPELPPRFNVF